MPGLTERLPENRHCRYSAPSSTRNLLCTGYQMLYFLFSREILPKLCSPRFNVGFSDHLPFWSDLACTRDKLPRYNDENNKNRPTGKMRLCLEGLTQTGYKRSDTANIYFATFAITITSVLCFEQGYRGCIFSLPSQRVANFESTTVSRLHAVIMLWAIQLVAHRVRVPVER